MKIPARSTLGESVQIRTPLSPNEIQILDRQVATLNYQLTEIAALLEARFGDSHDMAMSARTVQQECERLAGFIHKQVPRDGHVQAAGKAGS